MTTRSFGTFAHAGGEDHVVAGDAQQRETGDQHAGDRARLERDVEALASDLEVACAVRTLARTETFMPMKPAAPESTAPIRKPMATGQDSRRPSATKIRRRRRWRSSCTGG